jgi:hypothetical protein
MKKLFALLALSLLLFSCEEEETVSVNDIPEDIQRIIPDDVMEDLEDLGMDLNKGMTPPNVEGKYVVNKSLLFSSTVPCDPGVECPEEKKARGWEKDSIKPVYFSATYMEMFNQDNENNTIEMKISGWSGSAEGSGTYIMGSGDKFSVIFDMQDIEYKRNLMGEVDTSVVWGRANYLLAFSGRKTEEGFVDFDMGIYMKEIYYQIAMDYDDYIYWEYIPEETGRVIVDEDGLVEQLPDDFDMNQLIANLASTNDKDRNTALYR